MGCLFIFIMLVMLVLWAIACAWITGIMVALTGIQAVGIILGVALFLIGALVIFIGCLGMMAE